MSNLSSIKAGEAYVAISVEDKELVSGLVAAGDKIHAFADKVVEAEKQLQLKLSIDKNALNRAGQSVKDWFVSLDNTAQQYSEKFSRYFWGYTKAILAHGASLSAAALPFASFGDQLDKMAGRTGMSTQFLSEMSHVANLCGSSLQSVEAAVKGVQEKMLAASNGSKEVINALAELGLSYNQLKSMSPEQQFRALIFALSQIDDKTRQGGLAMRVFGESGRSLMNVIAAGAGSIEEMAEDARSLGVTLDTSAAAQAAKLTDCLFQLKQAALGISLEFGQAITPVLIASCDSLKEWLKYGREWVAWFGGAGSVLAGWSTGAIKCTVVLAALTGSLAVGSKVVQVYSHTMAIASEYLIGFYSAVSRNVTAAVSWINTVRTLAASYDTLGAAANMLLTALRLPIDVRANQIAAGLVLMSHAQTAAAAKSILAAKWQQACQIATVLITRLTAVTAATNALTVAERIAGIQLNISILTAGALTVAKSRLAAVMTWLNGLTLASVAAWVRDTAAKGAAAVATIALSVATKGLAGAFLTLSSAMAIASAHPIIAVIVATTAAIAALVISLRQACLYTAQLSREQQKLADKELKKRQTDQLKFSLLQTLSEKNQLSEKEMVRANQLIADLTGAYGDLGMSVDVVNKKIIKATDSQEKFNAAARKQAAERLAAQIAEEENNLKELRKQEEGNRKYREGYLGAMETAARIPIAWTFMGLVDSSDEKWQKDMAKEQKEIEEQIKKVNDLKKQKRQIEGGDTAQAFGADENQSLIDEAAKASDDTTGKKKIDELDKELARAEEERLRASLCATERIIHDNNRQIESYQEKLKARIESERSKPETQQDADKIKKLEEKIKELEIEKENFAKIKKREEEAKKILDVKKKIEDLERKFANETRTDLEKTLETIELETEEYRKQLELLKQQLEIKKNKTDLELKQLDEINKKLQLIDSQAAARKDAARKKDQEKKDPAKVPVIEERKVNEDWERRWKKVAEGQRDELLKPLEAELKKILKKEETGLVLMPHKKSRRAMLIKKIEELKQLTPTIVDHIKKEIWENTLKRVDLANKLADFAAQGNYAGYQRTLKQMQILDREKEMRHLNLLAAERRQALLELNKINQEDQPLEYKKALDNVIQKHREFFESLKNFPVPDQKQNRPGNIRAQIAEYIRTGMAQFDYAVKQGSGTFSALEAAQAGKSSTQESALAIAKQQAKYLKEIKDNTAGMDKEARFA